MPIVPRTCSATGCAGNAVKRTPENTAPTSFRQCRESCSRQVWGEAQAARRRGRSWTPVSGDDYWPFGQRVWSNGLSLATPPIRTLWGTNRIPRMGGPSPEEVAHMHFSLYRIAFAAAAAVFIFLMVHGALDGMSRSADVLAGLQ